MVEDGNGFKPCSRECFLALENQAGDTLAVRSPQESVEGLALEVDVLKVCSAHFHAKIAAEIPFWWAWVAKKGAPYGLEDDVFGLGRGDRFSDNHVEFSPGVRVLRDSLLHAL